MIVLGWDHHGDSFLSYEQFIFVMSMWKHCHTDIFVCDMPKKC